MNELFLYAGIILIGLMAILLYRIIQGPTVIDRILAVNVIGTKSIVLLIIIGILFDRVAMFIDIALGYGLLNLIASLAASKYFKKHNQLQSTSRYQNETGDQNAR